MRPLGVLFMLVAMCIGNAQKDTERIREALNDYMEGTSYSRPEQIRKAFYEEADLFLSHKEKPVWKVPADTYAGWYEKREAGVFNGRHGRIVSIDQSGKIAMAKVEIWLPKTSQLYTDMLLLKELDGQWKIISKTADAVTRPQKEGRILFIVSNAHYHGTSTLRTGNSFFELVNAYETFRDAGYTVDFVSPKGGAVPLAYINTSEPSHKKYIYDKDFMYALEHTLKPEEIDTQMYKAVHYIGGGAAMYGVADNLAIQKLVMTIYEDQNGIISSVCHGTAGITHLKTKDGRYLVSQKRISGYPDDYEKAESEHYAQFPFKIQRTIEARGGTFNYGPRNTAYVEQDGRVITGQNYVSSRPVALAIIKYLEQDF